MPGNFCIIFNLINKRIGIVDVARTLPKKVKEFYFPGFAGLNGHKIPCRLRSGGLKNS
jgi:hypothetical protein